MTGFGFYLLNLCTWSYGTLCVSRADAIPGFILAISGSLILGAGILWLLGPWGTFAYPRIAVYCTVCGHRLEWVLDSGQWYCSRCGEFRLRETKPQPHM